MCWGCSADCCAISVFGVQGGERFTFMRKRRRALRESWARFYVAAVVMGFGYLSSRDIVYRCAPQLLHPCAECPYRSSTEY